MAAHDGNTNFSQERPPSSNMGSGNSSKTPSECSCVEGIVCLLEEGAVIDAVDRRGFTPLCLAAAQGNVRLVKLLTGQGADVHHKNNLGFSPMYLAATKLKRETVFALRKYKAEVTFNELVRAIERKEVMDLLKEAGANLSAKDSKGRTLLHWAAWEGNREAVTWLIGQGGLKVDELDGDKWTPLHYAVRDGHLDVVQILLEEGARINIKDRWGDTPLATATFWGHAALCQTLSVYI